MNGMSMPSPASTALTSVAMMVAMMLPSFAPSARRYYRQLRAMLAPYAAGQSASFAMAYAGVWAAIGLAQFAIAGAFSPGHLAARLGISLAPWDTGAVLLCAGAVQRSRWKAERLVRCRDVCVGARSDPRSIAHAWRDGIRFGITCASSCAAPMAVLFAAGVMDARVMLVITAAITAERITPTGARIARLTGAIALVAGLLVCMQAHDLVPRAAPIAVGF